MLLFLGTLIFLIVGTTLLLAAYIYFLKYKDYFHYALIWISALVIVILVIEYTDGTATSMASAFVVACAFFLNLSLIDLPVSSDKNSEPQFISQKEAAVILGISSQTLTSWHKSGILQKSDQGFSKADLEEINSKLEKLKRDQVPKRNWKESLL